MIKRLSACIREYKKQTILTPTCMVGEVVCECTIPLLTADLINSIQNGCGMQTILFYGLRLFVIAMLSLGFGSLSGWFAAEAAAGFAKNLRHDLYYQVQSFSFANIDRFSTSSLVTRLTTDVTNIQNAFMMCIRIAVRTKECNDHTSCRPRHTSYSQRNLRPVCRTPGFMYLRRSLGRRKLGYS